MYQDAEWFHATYVVGFVLCVACRGVLLGMLVPGLEVSPCGQVAVDRLKRFRKKSAPEGKGADEDADADVDADEDETPGAGLSRARAEQWRCLSPC